jgi:hypothetical protein
VRNVRQTHTAARERRDLLLTKTYSQLSRITSDVLSQLYGDNAGSLDDLSVFDALRLGLDLSWRLAEWQRSVPEELRPRNVTGAANQPSKSPSIEAQRFQAILGLRYHGLCALVERPVLLKFLGFEPDWVDALAQVTLLRDSGVASLRRCIRSCVDCIALAKAIMDHWQDHKVLLSGAWWLTAYHGRCIRFELYRKADIADVVSCSIWHITIPIRHPTRIN